MAVAVTTDELDQAYIAAAAGCERCYEFGETHDAHCPEHPDHDPTPWCSWCGASRPIDCRCGPIVDNN